MDAASRFARAVRRLPPIRGKTQIGWTTMRVYERLGSLDGQLDIRLDNGSRLALPRSSPMSWALGFHGDYDASIQDLLSGYLTPGTMAIDIGASLGLWTVPLGIRAREAGAHVWAVEPHPNNELWLRRNIAANSLEDVVTVHICALGNADGNVIMQVPERGKGDAAGNAAIELDGRSSPSSVAVPIRRLDDLPRTRRVSVMKLDVEGFELQVLRGAEQLIEEDRPVIYGEFSRSWLVRRGEDPAVLMQTMQEIGYKAFVLEGVRSRQWLSFDGHRMRGITDYAGDEDLLFLPPGEEASATTKR